MQPRTGNQRGQSLYEFQRRHHESCTCLLIRFMSHLMIRRSKACSSLGAGARTAWNTGTPSMTR